MGFTWSTASSGSLYALGVSLSVSNPPAAEKVRRLYAEGLFFVAIGKEVGCDWRTVRNVLFGSGAAAHGGARRDHLGDEGRELYERLVAVNPRATDQWCARVLTKCLGKRISVSVVRTAMKRLGYGRKGITYLYSEGLTPLVIAQQHAFTKWWKEQQGADPRFADRVFFIDVKPFDSTCLSGKKRGVGRVGRPIFDVAPSDRGIHWDFIGAINRVAGLIAPYVYEGHVDAEVIECYFEYVLLPQMQPGDWLCLDGASYWSGRHVVEQLLWPLCNAFGISMVWLPARSPWFNPIEKFNGWLQRAVAEDVSMGRSSHGALREAVFAAIDARAAEIPAHCRGWVDYLYA